MTKQQKNVLKVLIVIAAVYFLMFIPPNSVGAADENMLSIFEVDEYALYNFNVRMIEGDDSIKTSIWKFITYQHYNYGFPSHFFSALVILPLKLLGSDYYTTANIMLVSRQVVSVLPMLAAMLILVYLQTRYHSMWKSVLLFLFLLSIPAVFKNNLWLHPESLVVLLIVLTFFFLDRDQLTFKRNFIYAAVACGLAAGTKLIGFFFVISIPTYIAWGYFSKKINLKTALIRAATFVGVMLAVFLLSNPMLFFPEPREMAIKMQQSLSEGITTGWTVEYTKGILPWFTTITKYYGEGITLILAHLVLLAGVIRGPRRLLNTMILTWAVPFSLYMFFVIVIRPFHFYMPIALPVYSSIGLLLVPFNRHQEGEETGNSSQVVKVLSILALLVVGTQFVLNVIWDVEEYDTQLNREASSKSIEFYDAVETACIDPIPDEIFLVISHDRAIYVPISEGWYTELTRSLVDYEYVQETNYHLLLLSQQRIRDYTQLDSLETAVDKTEMMAAQEFFADVVAYEVEGYNLCYENPFGFAYVREDLYQKYFDE